jgi:hypothetical protein
MQEVHDGVAGSVCWTEPYRNVIRALIDLFHKLYLPALFFIVGLIDTESVNPDDFGICVVHEMVHGGVQISGDWNGSVPYDYRLSVSGISPGVGQGNVLGVFIQRNVEKFAV